MNEMDKNYLVSSRLMPICPVYLYTPEKEGLAIIKALVESRLSTESHPYENQQENNLDQ